VVFSQRVFIPGAAALRLEFDEVVLSGLISDGSASYLRITSTLDGAQQRLNPLHVRQWNNTSAYFNGDEVIVELVAHGGTGDNLLRMSTVQAQFEPFVDRSICGATDDRELSSDNRTARLLPVGCTGWLIEDCNHCFLTAGHCSTSNNSITMVQFNVPLSNSNGSLNHPPPEDQYAPDTSSRQSNNGLGIGNDYAYFGVFPNSNTGLTPHEAYGDAFQLADPPAVNGQDIRITGYGTTSNPVPPQWNQVQKTHSGPYFSFGGTTVSYQTDTTGGNSGSPVIDDSTGMAIGIHTHGGCASNSGNYGTGYNHSGLQAALISPLGVCECPLLTFHFPDGLPELVDPAGGTTIMLEVLADGDVIPQPGTGMFYYDDGSGFVSMSMAEPQDNVYVATFPALDCGTTVRYYFSAETTDGEIAYEPRLAPSDAYEVLSAISYALVTDDDFNTDSGWSVTSQNLSSGAWMRGVPVNFGGNGPTEDHDGSGFCYITGNFVGDVDVDGGPTRLRSPIYDLTGLTNPFVSYARWFYNQPADEDRLTVEVSGDGGATWTLVTQIAHAGKVWNVDGFHVRDYLPSATSLRVRFSVADSPDDSSTEAGIDAVTISDLVCGDGCVGDFNGDGETNTLDVLDFLNAWNAGDDSGDFNGDGEFNTLDVLEFLNAWNAGC
jgi:V8-like Glu-specific endopeptidase